MTKIYMNNKFSNNIWNWKNKKNKKTKTKTKGIILGLLEESNQMRRRREYENSQISVEQLDWKFGTNWSFQTKLWQPLQKTSI